MRILFLCVVMSLIGCVHETDIQTHQPELSSQMRIRQDPWTTSVSSNTQQQSDYTACLEMYAGYAEAKKLCDQRMKARSPFLLPQPGYGPYDSYYGGQYGLYGTFPR